MDAVPTTFAMNPQAGPSQVSRTGSEPSSTRWLAVAVTFLTVVTAAGGFQWFRARNAQAWVVRSRQVIVSLERLLSDLRACESAQRGYLLVSRQQYLMPYQAARQAVVEESHNLELLSGDRASQAGRVAALRTVLDQKLGEMDQTIDLDLSQNRLGAIDIIETDRGRMLMQETERVMDEIREEESRLLRVRTSAEETNANASLAILLLGGAILLALLVAASIRINGQIGRQHALLADANGQMAELARSNEELQRFAFVTSHDLQEPLRIVASYSRLLRQRHNENLDAEAREFLHYIVTHVERMQSLIRDLLEYSRAGKRSEHMARVSTDSILQHALDNLRVSIAESHATITHDPLPEVTANAPQLILLFQNLIGNAIKFRGEQEPRIHVSCGPSDGFWLFKVADNGRGIEKEYLDRIFELFQRLNDDLPGTGIGLAMCRKTIESYGGRIWAESAPGQGSSFCFTLPAGPVSD